MKNRFPPRRGIGRLRRRFRQAKVMAIGDQREVDAVQSGDLFLPSVRPTVGSMTMKRRARESHLNSRLPNPRYSETSMNFSVSGRSNSVASAAGTQTAVLPSPGMGGDLAAEENAS